MCKHNKQHEVVRTIFVQEARGDQSQICAIQKCFSAWVMIYEYYLFFNSCTILSFNSCWLVQENWDIFVHSPMIWIIRLCILYFPFFLLSLFFLTLLQLFFFLYRLFGDTNLSSNWAAQNNKYVFYHTVSKYQEPGYILAG